MAQNVDYEKEDFLKINKITSCFEMVPVPNCWAQDVRKLHERYIYFKIKQSVFSKSTL